MKRISKRGVSLTTLSNKLDNKANTTRKSFPKRVTTPTVARALRDIY